MLAYTAMFISSWFYWMYVWKHFLGCSVYFLKEVLCLILCVWTRWFCLLFSNIFSPLDWKQNNQAIAQRMNETYCPADPSLLIVWLLLVLATSKALTPASCSAGLFWRSQCSLFLRLPILTCYCKSRLRVFSPSGTISFEFNVFIEEQLCRMSATPSVPSISSVTLLQATCVNKESFAFACQNTFNNSVFSNHLIKNKMGGIQRGEA